MQRPKRRGSAKRPSELPSQMLEEKLKAASNKQQANSEPGFVLARKESTHSQTQSRTQSTVCGRWQLAGGRQVVATATRRVSISHACKSMTNGPEGSRRGRWRCRWICSCRFSGCCQFAISRFRLPLLQLQPNCRDGNLFFGLLLLLRHATPCAALDDEQL